MAISFDNGQSERGGPNQVITFGLRAAGSSVVAWLLAAH